MAAAVRPAPQAQSDNDASITVARPIRKRPSRMNIDYRKMHRGLLPAEGHGSQSTAAIGKKAPASQVDTVLQAIGKVHHAVEQRMTQVEERMIQVEEHLLQSHRANTNNLTDYRHRSEQVRAVAQQQVKTIV